MSNLCSSMIALLLIFACSTDSDKEEEKTIKNTNSQTNSANTTSIQSIQDIQSAYEQISRDLKAGQLDSTSFQYNCFDEKTGAVTYYKKGEELQLIKHQRAEYSHFEATDQYFIHQNEPFFIFYDHLNWQFDTEAIQDGATVDKRTEYRYYLIDDELEQCLQKEFSVRSVEDENPNSQSTPNVEIDCPVQDELLDNYNILFAQKDRTDPMNCLFE